MRDNEPTFAEQGDSMSGWGDSSGAGGGWGDSGWGDTSGGGWGDSSGWGSSSGGMSGGMSGWGDSGGGWGSSSGIPGSQFGADSGFGSPADQQGSGKSKERERDELDVALDVAKVSAKASWSGMKTLVSAFSSSTPKVWLKTGTTAGAVALAVAGASLLLSVFSIFVDAIKPVFSLIYGSLFTLLISSIFYMLFYNKVLGDKADLLDNYEHPDEDLPVSSGEDSFFGGDSFGSGDSGDSGDSWGSDVGDSWGAGGVS